MANLKKILMASAAALMLSAPMAQVRAGVISCADYDNPDAYSSCKQDDPSLTNFEADAGIGNCCAGLASFKAACDLYHVHVESRKAASDMLKSGRAQHEWDKDYKACVNGATAARDAAFPKAIKPRGSR
jgi:hypothetical protein